MKNIKQNTNKPLTEKRVREIIRDEILKDKIEQIKFFSQIDTLAKKLKAKNA